MYLREATGIGFTEHKVRIVSLECSVVTVLTCNVLYRLKCFNAWTSAGVAISRGYGDSGVWV